MSYVIVEEEATVIYHKGLDLFHLVVVHGTGRQAGIPLEFTSDATRVISYKTLISVITQCPPYISFIRTCVTILKAGLAQPPIKCN